MMIEAIKGLGKTIEDSSNFYEVSVPFEIIDIFLNQDKTKMLSYELIQNRIFLDDNEILEPCAFTENCYNHIKSVHGNLQFYYILEYIRMTNPITDKVISEIIHRATS